MMRLKKFGAIGAGIGFCVALFLVALTYYLNAKHIVRNLDIFYLTLAPTSLMLMAADRATPLEKMTIILTFAVSNALIYSFLAFFIAGIWNIVSKNSNRNTT